MGGEARGRSSLQSRRTLTNGTSPKKKNELKGNSYRRGKKKRRKPSLEKEP